MKKVKSIIGMIISLGLIFLLVHPAILPLPQSVGTLMEGQVREHFLLKGSLPVTVSRLLGCVTAVLVVYVVSALLSLLVDLAGRK